MIFMGFGFCSCREEEAGYGLFVSKDYLLTYNLCTSYKKIHGSEAEQSATRTLVNGDKLAAVQLKRI
jgi:hypothetical protein